MQSRRRGKPNTRSGRSVRAAFLGLWLMILALAGTAWLLRATAQTAVRSPNCGLRPHTHTEVCYDAAGALVCTETEHTRTEQCGAQDDAPETELAAVLNTAADTAAGAATGETAAVLLSEEETADWGGMAVDEWIRQGSVSIEYYDKTSKSWKNVAENTIPANASLRISFSYDIQDAEALSAAGGVLYYELPELFIGDVQSGSLPDGAGEISVNEERLTLRFDGQWLEQHIASGSQIDGSVTFYATANWKEANRAPGSVTIGPDTIAVVFEKDIAAAYGTLDVQKTRQSGIQYDESGAPYIEYSLTVVGDPDVAMPDVSVTDVFSVGAEYIEGTDAVSLPEGTVWENGEWTIGEIEAAGSRTLIYRVRLKESYLGGTRKSELTNTASVYSTDKTTPKKTAEVTYTPQAALSVSKSNGEGYNEAEGSIAYTVTLTAGDNAYPLVSVSLKDALDVQEPYAQYLQYTDIRLDGEPLDDVVLTEQGEMTLNAGTFAPGQTKTLSYTVQVAPQMLASTSDTLRLKNTAQAFDPDGNRYGESAVTTEIDRKVWSRKSADDPLEQAAEITIPSGAVRYETAGGEEEITDAPTIFTVPAGSYRYTVIVNEAGDWNLSDSDFNDGFSPEYLAFTGWLKIEAYDVREGDVTPDMTDEQAVNTLKSKTPARTVWLKAEGTTFRFRPQQLGFADAAQAYWLTYYAAPTGDLQNVAQTGVTNTFTIRGTARTPGGADGTGGTEVEVPEIELTHNVVVTGGVTQTVKKYGWYFDRNQWNYGALYWIIEVQGTIPKDGALIDCTTSNGGGSGSNTNNHRIWENSIYGIYRGRLADTGLDKITDCADAAVMDALGFEKLTAGSDYRTSHESNYQLTITMEKSFQLSMEESLYIVVMTEPEWGVIGAVTSAEMFTNTVKTRSPGGDAVVAATALLAGNGADAVRKEAEAWYEYDRDKQESPLVMKQRCSIDYANDSNDNRVPYILTDALEESGTYVEWTVRLNWFTELGDGNLVLDTLPEGLEPVYVRLLQVKGTYFSAEYNGGDSSRFPTTPRISGLSADWIQHTTAADIYQTANEYYADAPTQNDNTRAKSPFQTIWYYNAETNQLQWQVDGLCRIDRDSVTLPSQYWCKGEVRFQVVCRVTDPVLLNGASGQKTYRNTVTVTDKNGRVSSAADSITLQKSTLQKTLTADANGQNRFMYTISLNPLSEDLDPTSDTLVLYDELKNPLVLDAAAIALTDAQGNAVTDCTVEFDTLTETDTDVAARLRLCVPDGKAMTLTYTVSLNAPPGTPTAMTNSAWWQGGEDNRATVSEERQYNTPSGNIAASSTGTLSLLKLDARQVNKTLAGAQFMLEQGTISNDGASFTATDGVAARYAETGSDGRLSWDGLTRGVVYRLTETKPPTGYLKQDAPAYFLFARLKEGSTAEYEEYSALPSNVKIIYDAAYTCQYTNRLPTLTFCKRFQDKGGRDCDVVPGTYTFGLYLRPNPAKGDEPYQTKTVTVTAQEAAGLDCLRVTFTDIEPETYYLYELDDEGTPITKAREGGTFAFGTNLFVSTAVNNTGIAVNGADIAADGTAGDIIITNRLNQFVLPGTGGCGAAPWLAGGAALSLTALGVGGRLGARRRKEADRTR